MNQAPSKYFTVELVRNPTGQHDTFEYRYQGGRLETYDSARDIVREYLSTTGWIEATVWKHEGDTANVDAHTVTHVQSFGVRPDESIEEYS